MVLALVRRNKERIHERIKSGMKGFMEGSNMNEL
jgi:hypothetical protein